MSKFHNKDCDYDGHHFDSLAERDRYVELKLMQEMGVIEGLELQKKYVLVPKGRYTSGKAYAEISYIADFVYKYNGEIIVEDVKGYKTDIYRMKKKMMANVYGIEVQEVRVDTSSRYLRKR